MPPQSFSSRNATLYQGNSNSNSQSHHQHTANNIGNRAAQAITSALANPYVMTYPSSYSYTNPNYYNACLMQQQQQQRPLKTAEGYSISSTYDPTSTRTTGSLQRGMGPPLPISNRATDRLSRPQFNPPGESKCTYQGCLYSGTKRSVETHMMDRHLIHPSGWKKRESDWDADPSLRGKPVPVPGTGLLLNTPEAIEAWLAERKKRYPSKQNIEEKKRKAQEAADRGEIDVSALTANTGKRRRVQRDDGGRIGFRRRRTPLGENDIGSRVPPQRDNGQDGIICKYQRAPDTSTDPHLCQKKAANVRKNIPCSGDSELDAEDSSESNSDMDPVKDAISSKTYQHYPPGFGDLVVNRTDVLVNEDGGVTAADPADSLRSASSATPVQMASAQQSTPKRMRVLHNNPFAARPSLLRNLLMPEIRHTVSHLSQAIHFLVENDFLEGVELNPGDAEKQRIKVIA